MCLRGGDANPQWPRRITWWAWLTLEGETSDPVATMSRCPVSGSRRRIRSTPLSRPVVARSFADVWR